MMKTWSDQPTGIEACDVLCSLTIHAKGHDRHVEIRQKPGDPNSVYFVTIGNLFGSETICCQTANAVFAALTKIKTSQKSPVDLPDEARRRR